MENSNENIPQEKILSKKEQKKAKKQAKKASEKARKDAKKQAKAAKKENRKKLSKADIKGIFLIIVLIAVAAVLLSVCIKASEDAEISADVNVNTTTQAALQTTVPPTVAPTEAPLTLPAVTEPTTVPQTVTDPVTTEKETANIQEQTTTKPAEAPSQPAATNQATLTDKEVLDIVTKGVNSLQSDTASYTGKQKQVIYIQLNDCSVPFLTDAINKVLEAFAGEEVYDYDFTNGKAMDPEDGVEVHAMHVFPPTDRLFTLSIDGVAKTSVTKNEKGTVYSVTVVPESATLENARPTHHNSASDVLDFSAFELPMGKVIKADFNYPGATISVTLDENGKVVEYHERLDMSGFGEGEILGITGSGDMEGYIDEYWSIQWK